MADQQRRVERREEEEKDSKEAVGGSGEVPAREAWPAFLPLLEDADEVMEEEEGEGGVEEEERDPRRCGGSPIRGPMDEEEEELRRKRKREVERRERKDSKRRRREEEGEEEKELGELLRRKVKKGFQSEPDNLSLLRKVTKRLNLRRCGTQPHLPEEEMGELGWKGAAERYGTVTVYGEEVLQERRKREKKAHEEAVAEVRRRKFKEAIEKGKRSRGEVKKPSGGQRKWAKREKEMQRRRADINAPLTSGIQRGPVASPSLRDRDPGAAEPQVLKRKSLAQGTSSSYGAVASCHSCGPGCWNEECQRKKKEEKEEERKKREKNEEERKEREKEEEERKERQKKDQ